MAEQTLKDGSRPDGSIVTPEVHFYRVNWLSSLHCVPVGGSTGVPSMTTKSRKKTGTCTVAHCHKSYKCQQLCSQITCQEQNHK